ncbi:MAG: 16S rRNA (cytidine(1402)-2'-O)-methyltransferase [SAR202 cluster bacterium Io17-Chloro-G2]|nr:MAG: 16S rRNA (cytidine(1402)-2'-O)-methyltransferase [SAR202 cluster bacterium Io17-Chloro-G2]
MGTLYVVGTPIGNLEDLTIRAVRVLGQVSLVAAEDTRVTRRLLNHLGIRVPLTSYHRHNWERRLPALLTALESGDVALVTDAGMPGVSDPGSELVAQAAALGFSVDVAPGPSSVTTAIALSGMGEDGFFFMGFLPRRRNDRRAQLEQVKILGATLVIFEAPHRVKAAVTDILATLGDRDIAVCREMTKLHQEVFRGTVSGALDHFTEPRGEFVLVVAGAKAPTGGSSLPVGDGRQEAKQQLVDLRAEGTNSRDAIALVGRETGLPRNVLYRLWLECGKPV